MKVLLYVPTQRPSQRMLEPVLSALQGDCSNLSATVSYNSNRMLIMMRLKLSKSFGNDDNYVCWARIESITAHFGTNGPVNVRYTGPMGVAIWESGATMFTSEPTLSIGPKTFLKFHCRLRLALVLRALMTSVSLRI